MVSEDKIDDLVPGLHNMATREWLADTLSKEYAPDFKQRLDKAKDLAKECKPESETLQSTLDKSKTGKTKDKHNP
jgi:hypothetical protein